MYVMVFVRISTLYSSTVVNKLYIKLSMMRAFLVEQLIPIVELLIEYMLI